MRRDDFGCRWFVTAMNAQVVGNGFGHVVACMQIKPESPRFLPCGPPEAETSIQFMHPCCKKLIVSAYGFAERIDRQSQRRLPRRMHDTQNHHNPHHFVSQSPIPIYQHCIHFAHSLTHPLTHSPTHPLTHSLTHLLTKNRGSGKSLGLQITSRLSQNRVLERLVRQDVLREWHAAALATRSHQRLQDAVVDIFVDITSSTIGGGHIDTADVCRGGTSQVDVVPGVLFICQCEDILTNRLPTTVDPMLDVNRQTRNVGHGMIGHRGIVCILIMPDHSVGIPSCREYHRSGDIGIEHDCR